MECLHTLVGGCCLALFGISSTVPVIQAHGFVHRSSARLAQSVECKALNLVVVGSSPTVGVFLGLELIQSRSSEKQSKALPFVFLSIHGAFKTDSCGI